MSLSGSNAGPPSAHDEYEDVGDIITDATQGAVYLELEGPTRLVIVHVKFKFNLFLSKSESVLSASHYKYMGNAVLIAIFV